MSCNYKNECKVTDCKYTETDPSGLCGLYCFLDEIDKELKKFPQ